MTFATKATATQANSKPAAATFKFVVGGASKPKVGATKAAPKKVVAKKPTSLKGPKKAVKKVTKKVAVAKPGASASKPKVGAVKATLKATVAAKATKPKSLKVKGLKKAATAKKATKSLKVKGLKKAATAKKATKKVAAAKPGVSKPKVGAAKKVSKKLVASKSKPKGMKGLKKAAKKAAKKVAVAKEQRFSAYQLFQKDHYATTAGAAAPEKMKALAAAWKALPAEQKQAYVTRSQSEQGLKKRNLTGMSLYIKENYSRLQSLPKLVEEWKQLGKEQKEQYSQRAAKGEGAKPLKRQSAKSKSNKRVSCYAAFMKKVYPTLPGTTLAERAKAAASQWKALSKEEKQAYTSAPQPAAPAKAKTQSGYSMYTQEQAKQNKLAFAVIASQWKAMTDAQREGYKAKARSL